MIQDTEVATIETPAPAETVIPPAEVDVTGYAEQIEAILITSNRPVSVHRLGQALGLIEVEQAPTIPPAEGQVVVTKPKRRKAKSAINAEDVITKAVSHLNDIYAQSGRAFRIENISGGFRLMTIAKHRAVIAQFHGLSAQSRLSKAAIETLAIIAYKQPMTRAKLEAVRGVACGEVLRSLMERRLITITGRAEELGRPMLYGTTKQFLEAFGLSSLKDLPSTQDFATLKREDR